VARAAPAPFAKASIAASKYELSHDHPNSYRYSGLINIFCPSYNAIDTIYRYPLRQSAIDQLNRQIRSGIGDQQLAELVVLAGFDQHSYTSGLSILICGVSRKSKLN
jgi:hypothetical protein